MALTFRRTGAAPATFADSSSLNGECGRSWGGYCMQRPGSGVTHFRCLSPKQLADSSGGNELIVASLAVKEILAELIAARELGEEAAEGHRLHLDATVVISGVAMDRVSRESKYLAAKLAMVREAVHDGKIELAKVPTALNTADIFTKALVGVALRRCRALVLGHPLGPDETNVADSAGVVLQQSGAVRTLTTWAKAAVHRRRQAAAKASAGPPEKTVAPGAATPPGPVTPRSVATGKLKKWVGAAVHRRRRAAAQRAAEAAAETVPEAGGPSGSN